MSMNVEILYESNFDLGDPKELKEIPNERLAMELARILGLYPEALEIKDREQRIAGTAIEFFYKTWGSDFKVQLYLALELRNKKVLYLLYHGPKDGYSAEYEKLLRNELPSFVREKNRYSDNYERGPVKLGLNMMKDA